MRPLKSVVHPLEYKSRMGWASCSCNALFVLVFLSPLWSSTASAEMVPVAPEASEWIYTGVRCEAVTTYPSEEAAIQGGVALFNGYCGDASVASRGVWGTTAAPVRGACGSTIRYPKFSLGVENRNIRHVKILYCNGLPDGWYVYRTRTVRCPAGYSNASNQCLPTGENTAKALSSCEPGTGVAVVGNTINISSRSKQETTADIVVDAAKGWVFKRHYSSRAHYHGGRMGKHWRHTFERRLVETKNSAISSVALYRDDGQVLRFSLLNGAWKADGDIDYRLVGLDVPSTTARWQVTTPRDEIETYDEHGNLSQVARHGQIFALSYDENRWLKNIRYPSGAELALTYHPSGLLKMVQLSDDLYVKYKYSSANLLSHINDSEGDFSALHYEDARFPGALTGLTDERGVRFATWAYDEQGRPTLSEHAEGMDRTTLTYHSDGKITVANALGKQAVYSFKFVNGLKRVSSVQGTPSLNCAGANRAYTYTPDGRLKSKTDWKGHLTTYDYNERGLEISRTEAAGTPQARTVTTEWHPTLFLPETVTEPSRITHYTYDDQGRQLSQSVTQR